MGPIITPKWGREFYPIIGWCLLMNKRAEVMCYIPSLPFHLIPYYTSKAPYDYLR